MEDQETNPEVQEVPNKEANMYDVMFGSATTNPEQSSTEQPQEEEEPLILSEQSQEAEEEVYEEVEEVEVSDEEEYEETPQSYTVKVDGEKFEVTLDELTNGYQRQSDYTKKSQSVAEMRKAYEANLQSVQTERGQYQEVLANMEQYQSLELQKFQELDWTTLKADDPVEYMEKRIEFQDAKDRVVQVRQEQVNVQQKTQQEVYHSVQQKVHAEAKLLSTALPEYSDPSSTLKDDLRGYALGAGFTEQDVNAITDHKVVLMLHKAFLQDRANSSKTSKVTKKSPNKVLKSGNPVGKTQRVNRDVKARRDKLSKSGNKQDAVNAFMDLI